MEQSFLHLFTYSEAFISKGNSNLRFILVIQIGFRFSLFFFNRTSISNEIGICFDLRVFGSNRLDPSVFILFPIHSHFVFCSNFISFIAIRFQIYHAIDLRAFFFFLSNILSSLVDLREESVNNFIRSPFFFVIEVLIGLCN